MYLHQIAKKVVTEHQGVLPNNTDILATFPGLGKATAASICAFAYNSPTVFIETNIRAVFIYFSSPAPKKFMTKKLSHLLHSRLTKNTTRDWYTHLWIMVCFLKKQTPIQAEKVRSSGAIKV